MCEYLYSLFSTIMNNTQYGEMRWKQNGRIAICAYFTCREVEWCEFRPLQQSINFCISASLLLFAYLHITCSTPHWSSFWKHMLVCYDPHSKHKHGCLSGVVLSFVCMFCTSVGQLPSAYSYQQYLI